MKNNIIYAPPLDIPSFQLTVTEGCSHNKCTFCTMFRDIVFRTIPTYEIEKDLRQASADGQYFDRVFLESGDAFVLSAKRLLEIAELIHRYLPNVEVISAYASVKNIMSKTDAELRTLAKAGFGKINIGIESGLDDVLSFMNKGFTVAQAKEQLLRLRKANMPFSINIIGGSAGPHRLRENALASAAFCNEVKPELIYFMPLQADKESLLAFTIETGKFIKSNLGEFVTEEIEFLSHLETDDCTYFAAHMLNPVPLVGSLPNDKERMIDELRDCLTDYRKNGMSLYQLNF